MKQITAIIGEVEKHGVELTLEVITQQTIDKVTRRVNAVLGELEKINTADIDDKIKVLSQLLKQQIGDADE